MKKLKTMQIMVEKLLKHIFACTAEGNDQFLYRKEMKKLRNFERVYATSNEMLFKNFKDLNLEGKNILTVGSSGDQVLYSLLFGAENVTCFDVNSYTKYFYDLKVAAIKTFDFEEFKKRFHFTTIYEKPKYDEDFLSFDTYQKIRHALPEDSKYVWDNIFIETDRVPNFLPERVMNFSETYLSNKKIYDALKKTLLEKEHNVQFFNSSIQNITDIFNKKKIKTKYDFIFLSNIFDYFTEFGLNEEKVESYKDLMQSFIPYLNPDGKIQIDYLYGRKTDLDIFNNILNTFGQKNIQTNFYETDMGKQSPIYYVQENTEQTK